MIEPDEVVSCGICSGEFLAKDNVKHGFICDKFVNRRGHPYIHVPQEAAHGLVTASSICPIGHLPIVKTPTPKECSELSIFLQKKLILLHPIIMQSMNISLGDTVSLTYYDGTENCCLAIVWPCQDIVPSFSLAFGALNSLYLKVSGYVSVQRVRELRNAQLVTLAPANGQKFKQYFSTPQFHTFLSRYCMGCPLVRGEKMTLHYPGQRSEKCELIVHSVDSVKDRLNSRDNVDSMAQNLTDLSLDLDYDQSSSADVTDASLRGLTGSPFLSTSTPAKSVPYRSLLVDADKTWILYPRVVYFFVSYAVANVWICTSETKFSIIKPGDTSKTFSEPKYIVNFDAVGGLKQAKIELHSYIRRPLSLCTSGKQIPGIKVLLYGYSGAGKTLLATALQAEISALSLAVDIVEGAENCQKIFEKATKNSPCLVVIDNLDQICVKDSGSSKADSRKMQLNLCKWLDGIESGSIFVLAVTNRPDLVDINVRRRFDAEIECPVPNRVERAEILTKILDRRFANTKDKDIVQIVAEKTHGYTGADLLALCKQAYCSHLHNNGDSLNELSLSDFAAALLKVRPSAMREIILEIPKVYWSDIGGLEEIKQKLKQAIEWPIKHPEVFDRLGIRAPSGVLLYGPPGCSKTMIAKALATESALNFVAVKGPELFSKWVGESERAVRDVFRKARQAAPSIIFFDEIDALAVQRGSDNKGVGDRVLTQLLTELDGIEPLSSVSVVAATNRPDVIDQALLRPGRLDRLIYVPLPTLEARAEIFRLQFRRTPTAPEVTVDKLAVATKGYSGAEVVAVCQEAAVIALQECLDAQLVGWEHFQRALGTVLPRTDPKLLDSYLKFAQVNS